MPNKEIMAAIVLAAQVPGRVALAQEVLKRIQATDPAHSYFIETVEGSTTVPVPEADWEFRIARIVRTFEMHDTATVSVTVTAKHRHKAEVPSEEEQEILTPRSAPREPQPISTVMRRLMP
ncbi:MAG: hypothetical protein OXE96_16390 [Gemmatimonadetes bacterium]|nr:hypothetical protein [Gemmatimonadota bacterium]